MFYVIVGKFYRILWWIIEEGEVVKLILGDYDRVYWNFWIEFLRVKVLE